jgi:RHS repeat-associated protein
MTESLSQEQEFGGQAEVRSFDYTGRGLERLGTARKTSGTQTAPYRAYMTDAAGSVEGLEDDQGNLLGPAYSYDPYGTQLNDESALSADAQANPFRFEGHYYDSGAKTYDMRARAYLPEIARFLGEDRYEDPLEDQGLETEALTQDRYAFAGGNPVDNIEFDGHEPIGSYQNPCDNTYGSDERCAEASSERREASARNQRDYNYAYSTNWKAGRATSTTSDRRFVRQYVAFHLPAPPRPSEPLGRYSTPPPPRPDFDIPQPSQSGGPGEDVALTALSCLGAKWGCLKAAGAVVRGAASLPRIVGGLIRGGAASGPKEAGRLWAPQEVAGRRVYQRDDLIDPMRTNARGETSLALMQRGRSPIGPDGRPVQLHHVIQKEPGPVAEITQGFHQRAARQLHINPSNTLPSGIDRVAFRSWKTEYWMRRASDFQR